MLVHRILKSNEYGFLKFAWHFPRKLDILSPANLREAMLALTLIADVSAKPRIESMSLLLAKADHMIYFMTIQSD